MSVITSVDTLPVMLSLDVTAGLVFQGVRAPWKPPTVTGDLSTATYTLNVLDVSDRVVLGNPTMVVTLPANSLTIDDAVVGIRGPDGNYSGRVYHVVIAGVTGNDAANKIDTADKTLRNDAWYAVALDATHLALFDVSDIDGSLVWAPSSGMYTGGGTVSKALTDAQILVGQEHIREQSAAPRIVMVPLKTTYGPKAAKHAHRIVSVTQGEIDAERVAPSFMTVTWWYEVHVWGLASAAGTSDVVRRSFGAAQILHDQIWRSANDCFSGCYEFGNGGWLDQHEGQPQRVKQGHELVFQIGLPAPIAKEPVILSPVGTTLDAVLTFAS